ncbi:MAG TPA: hypothetical protein VFN23_04295 [Ktedonobacteraceae bacterium]|nr:hypothetical protein [Ktedonobacteraceae bacterium]
MNRELLRLTVTKQPINVGRQKQGESESNEARDSQASLVEP